MCTTNTINYACKHTHTWATQCPPALSTSLGLTGSCRKYLQEHAHPSKCERCLEEAQNEAEIDERGYTIKVRTAGSILHSVQPLLERRQAARSNRGGRVGGTRIVGRIGRRGFRQSFRPYNSRILDVLANHNPQDPSLNEANDETMGLRGGEAMPRNDDAEEFADFIPLPEQSSDEEGDPTPTQGGRFGRRLRRALERLLDQRIDQRLQEEHEERNARPLLPSSPEQDEGQDDGQDEDPGTPSPARTPSSNGSPHTPRGPPSLQTPGAPRRSGAPSPQVPGTPNNTPEQAQGQPVVPDARALAQALTQLPQPPAQPMLQLPAQLPAQAPVQPIAQPAGFLQVQPQVQRLYGPISHIRAHEAWWRRRRAVILAEINRGGQRAWEVYNRLNRERIARRQLRRDYVAERDARAARRVAGVPAPAAQRPAQQPRVQQGRTNTRDGNAGQRRCRHRRQ